MAFGTYTQTTTLETSTETRADLNGMLKRFNPYNILKDEMIKRTYFVNKVSTNSGYMGGVMDIPFQAAKGSSYRMGKLVASTNITQSKYVKGKVEGYKEIWGALKFYDHDLQRHKSLEQSFVAKLLDEIPEFIEGMKEKVSLAMLSGASYIFVTDATDVATGGLVVDRPEYLEIGQYVELGATSALKAGYISRINMNSGALIVVTSMTDVDASTNPVDLTGILVGHSLRLEDGFDTSLAFNDLPNQLLSVASGGSATLYGQSKAQYPFLQSFEIDGASIADGKILGFLFDAFIDHKRIGKKSNVTEVIMSYKNLGNAMKELEYQSAAGTVGEGRQFTASDSKTTAFGWSEVTVATVTGQKIKLVGINEMRNDLIFGLDWSGIQMYSNGMFDMRKSPKTGDYFYEERTENGYIYIVDVKFFGELVVSKPSYQFVIHNISY